MHLSRSCTSWPTCCNQALPSVCPSPPSYITILIHPWINLVGTPASPRSNAYHKPAGSRAHEHAPVTFFQFGSTFESFYHLPKNVIKLSNHQWINLQIRLELSWIYQLGNKLKHRKLWEVLHGQSLSRF